MSDEREYFQMEYPPTPPLLPPTTPPSPEELMFPILSPPPPPRKVTPSHPLDSPPSVSLITGRLFGEQESPNRGTKRENPSDGPVSGFGGQNESARSKKRAHSNPSPPLRSTTTSQMQRKSTREQYEDEFRDVLVKLNNLQVGDLKEGTKRADEVVKTIQAQQDLSRMYVTISIDNLMVAVELRDNPSLVGYPLAICSSTQVHATNDLAKAAGVMEPMSILDAYVKYPSIVVVLVDFPKYIQVIKEMGNLLRSYDNDMKMSTDSAQLDLTDYLRSPIVKRRRMNVMDVVEEMQMKVKLKLNLDTYAGIGPTIILSKFASLVNKPSGVHRVESNKTAIKKFLKGKLMSEHCGLCPRTEYILKALQLYTTDHVWKNRGVLFFIMKPQVFKKLLGVCMGITVEVEKLQLCHLLPRSVGKNANMYATRDVDFLRKVCLEVCNQMALELTAMGVGGTKMIVEVTTVENYILKRGYILDRPINSANLLFRTLSEFINKYIIQVANVSIIQLTLHVLQLSRIEPLVLTPSPSRQSTAAGQQSTASSIHASDPNQSETKPDNNQESNHRILQLNLLSKPIDFACPNCKMQIKSDVANNGESIMAKHVDFCLMSRFPRLVGGL